MADIEVILDREGNENPDIIEYDGRFWREATTCHDKDGGEGSVFTCSVCGEYSLDSNPHFCPWCGAEVVEAP
jgi:rubrerythrin